MPVKKKPPLIRSAAQLIEELGVSKKKKLTGSLRDQLKQAGLVTSKQAKKAEKGAHRQNLRIKKGVEVDENKQAVEAARLEKLERDKQKNAELNLKAQIKSIAAQVKQLVSVNSKRQAGDIAYQFSDNNKVKSIHISQANKTELNKGYLAIVRKDDGYDLVPLAVSKKIEERSPESVVYWYDRSADQMDEDDPYKDYVIPDDLEW